MRRPYRMGASNRKRSAGALGNRVFAAAHLEAVAAVYRLDVEDLAPGNSKHALDRCGYIFVHAVRKFDHNDRPFPRRPHETTSNGAGPLPELAENNFHKV